MAPKGVAPLPEQFFRPARREMSRPFSFFQGLTRLLPTGEPGGLRREEVYIANILKCRPPGNRDPLPDEIEACTPWLVETISAIQPALVVTLGNFATKFVLGTDRGITSLRGKLFHVDGRQVVPIFHPASALYDGS